MQHRIDVSTCSVCGYTWENSETNLKTHLIYLIYHRVYTNASFLLRKITKMLKKYQFL